MKQKPRTTPLSLISFADFTNVNIETSAEALIYLGLTVDRTV